MSWWDIVCKIVNVGDVLYTPGRGLDGGSKKKSFEILSKDQFRIIIRSGNTKVPLVKKCFDTIEGAFIGNKHLRLRVASSHDNEPFRDSADEIIRKTTNSQLARGNYVCSILEYCKLVKYAMIVNKKVIILP